MHIEVTVLAFGIAKEIFNSTVIKITVEEGYSVAQLREKLALQYPELGRLRFYMVAVNSEYATDDMVINEGDEVAIIPPVSGG